MDGSRFRNLSRKESDSAHAHVSTPVFHMDIDTTNQAKKRTTSSTKLKAQLLALDGMEPCHSLILKWEQISSSHPEKKNASLTLSGVCKIVTNFNILTLQMCGKKYLK